ncbi:MAG: hypothetical protein ACM3OB_10115 [Acidobacteriota bacterium]
MPVRDFQFVEAHLALLALLAAATSTVAAAAVWAWLRGHGRREAARHAAAIGLAIPALYAVALLGLGALSRERTLAMGQEKYFCEADCHLAYAVVAAQPGMYVAGGGPFLLVTVRLRFDETTISPGRGDAPLQPNPRRIEVVDRAGHHYPVVAAATKALAAAFPKPDLDQPLRPGEARTAQLAFAVPPSAQDPRLLIVSADWPTRLLLGHETSPLAGRAYFKLTR